MSSTLSIFGTAGHDDITLAGSGSNVYVYINTPATGTPSQIVPAGDLDGIDLYGGNGGDTVTLDYTHGDPIPAGLYLSAGSDSLSQPTLSVIGIATGTASAPAFVAGVGEFQIGNTAQTFADLVTYDRNPDLDLFSGTDGGSLIVNPSGAVTFTIPQHADSIDIYSGGLLTLAPNAQLLDTDTLQMDGSLNLNNNDLMVRNAGYNFEVGPLLDAVNQGHANPGGDGTIYSSLNNPAQTVVAAPPGGTPLTVLDDIPVPPTALVARYTYLDDTNFDGASEAQAASVGGNYYVALPPVDLTAGISTVNWGDGTTDTLAGFSPYVQHTYTTAGSYVVRSSVTGTDPGGDSATAVEPNTTVNVTADDPDLAPLTYSAPTAPDGSYLSAGGSFAITSDGGAFTQLTYNGAIVASAPTADVTAVNINGPADSELDIDTRTAPVPAAGVFFNGGTINLGQLSSDSTVLATSTETVYQNLIIRHPDSTAIDNTAGDGDASIVALDGEVPAGATRAEIRQYSSVTNARISFSRSAIRRTATDWTRPALRWRATFFQSRGESS